jgi:FixJ family two-component response regulator
MLQPAPSSSTQPQPRERVLLLVDDETNILASLQRLFRPAGYRVLTASSGMAGLELLADTPADVIISDQRMPGMLGVDFLRQAKVLYPDSIRIMLSGYTELQSVTAAVNEGAIYKFLTKPWDDELLRGHVEEAFRIKEIADDNARLNRELRLANEQLERLVHIKEEQIALDLASLRIARELLQYVPLPVLGVDDRGMVAFSNALAESVFQGRGELLGAMVCEVAPELSPNAAGAWPPAVEIKGVRYQLASHAMGNLSASRGTVLVLTR